MPDAKAVSLDADDSLVERERELTAEKYRLFSQHRRGLLSTEELVARVRKIDGTVSPRRTWLKHIVGALLPLLFVGRTTDT